MRISQLPEHPAVFGGDLLHDRTLHVSRKDAPGVSLDLEMLAGGRMSLAPSQRFLDVGVRGGKGWRGLCIERDVEMDTGFLEIRGRNLAAIDRRKEGREIEETGERGIRPPRDHLVEIGRLVEAPDCVDGGGIGGIQ